MPRLPTGDPVPTSFGDRLRVLREAASLTQEELAERAGLSVNGVSALERGTRRRPYPHTVRNLAEALALDEEERAWLVGGVRPAAPPERTARPLPAPSTALVGRDADVDEVARLLAESRIVTLTGPGGVGKTRLAVEVARRVAGRFRDGVAFVPLAPVADPAGVPGVVARELGLREAETSDPVAALVETLRPLQLLLVLDNFEQLLPAAGVVADVVRSCPDLTVLVSSRAVLRVGDEREWVVRPLQLPPSTRDPDPAEVLASPAGELFLARARAVLPTFEVTDATAGDVAAICWRLAGLPLALELAAVNVRLLTPAALLEHLDEALATGWTRDLPERQRGLRRTLDWSYRLLDPAPQSLFRRLAVFAGGFSLDAVEAVAGLSPRAALGSLRDLVEHSLVTVAHADDGQVRYDLLQPIREYADSLLTGAERRAAFAAHAAHFRQLVEQAAPALQTGEQVAWLGRLERDDGNIRRAIAESLADGDAETAARMCWSMWLAWWLRGGDLQGRAWVEAALEHALPDGVRSAAATAAACLAYVQGDYDHALLRWRQGTDAARAAGDVGMAANGVAGVGLVALASGDLAVARTSMSEALSLTEDVEADWLRSLLLVWLGTVDLVEGDEAAATTLFEQGLALARARGDRLVTYVALYNLAQAATAAGRAADAAELLHEGVLLSQETGDLANTAYFLDALAVVEGQTGRWQRAALLLGAAEAARSATFGSGYNYYLPDEALRAQTIADARAALGERFDELVEQGRHLEPEDALAG